MYENAHSSFIHSVLKLKAHISINDKRVNNFWNCTTDRHKNEQTTRQHTTWMNLANMILNERKEYTLKNSTVYKIPK